MSFLFFFTLMLHADGGAPLPPPRADEEVVKNLELLELMDETSDFELLQELSVER